MAWVRWCVGGMARGAMAHSWCSPLPPPCAGAQPVGTALGGAPLYSSGPAAPGLLGLRGVPVGGARQLGGSPSLPRTVPKRGGVVLPDAPAALPGSGKKKKQKKKREKRGRDKNGAGAFTMPGEGGASSALLGDYHVG